MEGTAGWLRPHRGTRCPSGQRDTTIRVEGLAPEARAVTQPRTAHPARGADPPERMGNHALRDVPRKGRRWEGPGVRKDSRVSLAERPTGSEAWVPRESGSSIRPGY